MRNKISIYVAKFTILCQLCHGNEAPGQEIQPVSSERPNQTSSTNPATFLGRLGAEYTNSFEHVVNFQSLSATNITDKGFNLSVTGTISDHYIANYVKSLEQFYA